VLARPRLVACALIVLGALVSCWFAGYRLGGNDEGALLTAAAKILRGGVFYRDIDAYPFPGAHYLLALAMGIFGEHLAVSRALAGVVYCGVLVALYAVALQLVDRRRAALFGLSLLGFKFLAWPAFTCFFYWDLAFLAACAATALFTHEPVRPGRTRLLAVGACVGIAFLSKQSLGIYLATLIATALMLPEALFAAPREGFGRRAARLASLSAGFLIPVAPLLAYFAYQGVLVQMFESGLIRPFTAYLSTSGISFSTPLRWWEFGSLQGPAGFSYFPESYFSMLRREVLPGEQAYPLYWTLGELFVRLVYLSVPLAFAGALALCLRAVRRGRHFAERRLIVFAGLACGVVLSAFPRSDFAHVIGVYPLVLLLLFAVAGRLWRDAGNGRAPTALLRLEAVLVCTWLAVLGGLSLINHASLTTRVDLHRAELWEAPENAFLESVVRFVREEVEPGGGLFVYGHEAYYYFLADRFFDWPFSQLYPGQAGGDAGEALVARLERDPPQLVIRGFVRFPGVPGLPDQLPVLQAFLENHFEVDERVFLRHPPTSGILPRHHRLEVLRPRSSASARERPSGSATPGSRAP